MRRTESSVLRTMKSLIRGTLLGLLMLTVGSEVAAATSVPDVATHTTNEIGRAAPMTFRAAVDWLQRKSTQMIHACRRRTRSGVTAFPPQVGGGYDAFWLRDYAYMLEGNVAAFSNQELEAAYRFFMAGQRADGAMVDCIKFDGTPIYKPGYGTMGKHPVADGSQFAVDVAWYTYHKTHNRQLMAETVDRLIRGMRAVPRDPTNGLVYIQPGATQDRCPYGFTDTIRKQGDVLFCSLLYVQASRQLGDLLAAVGRPQEARAWRQQARQVSRAIRRVFWDANLGLFQAATVVCRQPDLWGSAFAVYLGVANRTQAQAVARYFQAHYHEIIQRGQLRDLPGGMNWEATMGTKPGTYQNGGYWATPVGWFVVTLNRVDPTLARQTVIDLVQEFIKTGDEKEWINHGQAGVSHYLASATLPLAGIRRIMASGR